MENDGSLNPMFALPESVNLFAALFLEPTNPLAIPPGRYDQKLQLFVDLETGLPMLTSGNPTHEQNSEMTDVPGCYNQTTAPCSGCSDSDSTCTHTRLDFSTDDDES
jgi:hypothetical protein